MLTIYRCDCGHKHLDHERSEGAPCSFGGCRCTHSTEHVMQEGSKEQIPTIAAFDQSTGKWAIGASWS